MDVSTGTYILECLGSLISDDSSNSVCAAADRATLIESIGNGLV